MRVVIDTSVIVSAFLGPGVPRRVFIMGLSYSEVYTSPFLLDELDRVLKDKLGMTKEQRRLTRLQISRYAKVIQPAALENAVPHIGADNEVLACAQASSADFIITGDKELLGLGRWGRTKIISPREFFELLQ